MDLNPVFWERYKYWDEKRSLTTLIGSSISHGNAMEGVATHHWQERGRGQHNTKFQTTSNLDTGNLSGEMQIDGSARRYAEGDNTRASGGTANNDTTDTTQLNDHHDVLESEWWLRTQPFPLAQRSSSGTSGLSGNNSSSPPLSMSISGFPAVQSPLWVTDKHPENNYLAGPSLARSPNRTRSLHTVPATSQDLPSLTTLPNSTASPTRLSHLHSYNESRINGNLQMFPEQICDASTNTEGKSQQLKVFSANVNYSLAYTKSLFRASAILDFDIIAIHNPWTRKYNASPQGKDSFLQMPLTYSEENALQFSCQSGMEIRPGTPGGNGSRSCKVVTYYNHRISSWCKQIAAGTNVTIAEIRMPDFSFTFVNICESSGEFNNLSSILKWQDSSEEGTTDRYMEYLPSDNTPLLTESIARTIMEQNQNTQSEQSEFSDLPAPLLLAADLHHSRWWNQSSLDSKLSHFPDIVEITQPEMNTMDAINVVDLFWANSLLRENCKDLMVTRRDIKEPATFKPAIFKPVSITLDWSKPAAIVHPNFEEITDAFVKSIHQAVPCQMTPDFVNRLKFAITSKMNQNKARNGVRKIVGNRSK